MTMRKIIALALVLAAVLTVGAWAHGGRVSVHGRLVATASRPGGKVTRNPAVGWLVLVTRHMLGERPLAQTTTRRGGWFELRLRPGRYLVAGERPGSNTICSGTVVKVTAKLTHLGSLPCGK